MIGYAESISSVYAHRYDKRKPYACCNYYKVLHELQLLPRIRHFGEMALGICHPQLVVEKDVENLGLHKVHPSSPMRALAVQRVRSISVVSRQTVLQDVACHV